MNVGSFLKNALFVYKSASSSKVSVVLGNQSCDLDSIVSAIATSYFMSQQSNEKSSAAYVPMLNSTKSIVASKKECMYLLEHLSVTVDDFVYISEWNKETVTDVILVDHNELDDQERALGIHSLVRGVIDHHLDKNEFRDAQPRIINPTAGSNASLVAELFYQTPAHLDHSFASMLIFPILSDTNNLTTRTSDKDIAAVEFLKPLAPHFDSQKMYARLEEIKFAASGDEDLDTLLKKDYKQYETRGKKWGMSSVNFCIQDWLVKSESANLTQVGEFMKAKQLSLFGILSCFKLDGGDFKRDMVLFGNGELLSRYQDEHLSLIKTARVDNDIPRYEQNDAGFAYTLYGIDDVKHTRKYWQPSLERYLSSSF
jgi:inorganic pyrophosphatase/exopolyphosphatase